MKMKKLLALVLALMMTVSLLAGCGSNAADMMYDAPAAEAPVEDYVSESFYDTNKGLTSTDSSQAPLPEDQKIITTVYMDAETEDMNALLEKINAKVAELGGYMEAQDIYNGSSYSSYRSRHANLTVRIPAAKLNGFVEHVSSYANIISQNTSTENVTLSYIATESRITALETEQDRLLELLAKAENMEEILIIESRLTEVRTELEQVTSVLRSYDNRINYSTIHLGIAEVIEYTEVEEEPETFWDRISKGFVKSLKNVGDGIMNFVVFLVVALPYLAPFVVIAVVIILLIKRPWKKKNKKQTPNSPNNPQ